MAATAVHPFRQPPTPEGQQQSGSQFVQMQDGAAGPGFDIHQEEVRVLEKRGRRLRRAALAMGIFLVISIICTCYSFFAIRWNLIDYFQPEKTHYVIEERIGAFRFGVLCETLMIIAETFIGILMGIILIGAGVNPAMSVMVVTFKIIQQAICGANAITLVAALLLYDPANRYSSVIQAFFYSDWTLGIGQNLAYLFLLINRYGHIFSECKFHRQVQPSLIWFGFWLRFTSVLSDANMLINALFFSLCPNSVLWYPVGSLWFRNCHVGCLPTFPWILHCCLRPMLHPEFLALPLLA